MCVKPKSWKQTKSAKLSELSRVIPFSTIWLKYLSFKSESVDKNYIAGAKDQDTIFISANPTLVYLSQSWLSPIAKERLVRGGTKVYI